MALISYITGYIYFINSPKSLNSSTNNWDKCYLSSDQVDRKAVNLLTNKDLVLNIATISYCFAAVCYII